jgi:DNA-binding transcriptional regulator YdaS (Cro superfamily)
MDLSSYLRDRKVTASALATQLGCSVSTVTRIRDGLRRPSLRRALQIEAATGGSVTVADLDATVNHICLTGEIATEISVSATEMQT